MKLRRSLTAIVLGLSTIAAFAQTTGNETRQIKEKGKIIFNPHWFMQVQAGASHTLGEAKFGDLISPAAALNVGYQFTPLWGLRAGLSGWEAKGGWVTPSATYKYNYLQGNIDATLNLSNLFCRYNPKRVFNAYLFLGVGINGAFNNDEAIALAQQGADMRYLWTDNKINPVGRGGLGADFRLTDRLFFNLEVNANILSDKYNSKKAGNPDWQFNALGGFTIKFGKTYKKTEPIYYDPTPAPAPVQEEEKPAPAPAPVPVKEEVKPMTQNIFFKINSAVIRSSEESKIDALVAFMQENENTKVSICGYADKKTGNANINLRLSEKRAEAVAAALKEKGIAENRIEMNYKGDTEQPFSVNEENRVTICIAAE